MVALEISSQMISFMGDHRSLKLNLLKNLIILIHREIETLDCHLMKDQSHYRVKEV